MKPGMLKAAALAGVAAGFAAAGGARAADYVVIPLETAVEAPADVAWKRIDGFCDIGAWLHTSCEITSGHGVGEVRRIAGRVDEVLVAETPWSYTYAQPKSPIDYHGTVEIRADGPNRSRLFYTLVYDAAALSNASPETKAKDVAQRTRMFTGVVATMKKLAEAK